MKRKKTYIPGKSLTKKPGPDLKLKATATYGIALLSIKKYGKYIIFVGLAMMIALTGILGGAMVGYIKTATPITRDQLTSSKFSTQVFDKDNNLISELSQYGNREWVNYDDVPKYVTQALVAIEDERFLQHEGVDILGLFRAVFRKLTNPGSVMTGASTITMQVVKNVTGDDKRSLRRKVQEWWRAIELEKNIEKWEILQIYMNIIVTGINIYGVQAAAREYFGKDASQLTLAEAASIAGITNNPNLYTPTTTRGREKNKNRQVDILDKMLELEMIDKAQYDTAIAEELKFAESKSDNTVNAGVQSYFVDQVVIDVKREFMQQGLSESEALNKVYNGGLKIYTTMDQGIQKTLDETYQNSDNFPVAIPGNPHGQSSMVILDVNNAQVRGLYGGYGLKTTNSLNRATQIERQPGSVMKPIAVYGPAINEKVITAATVVDDAPVYMMGVDEGLYPMNYDKAYRGLVNVRDAVKFSYNVPAALIFDEYLGSVKSLEYLKKVGIDRDQHEVSLALGGMSKGINPLQAASAFIPFANRGLYFTPTTFTKVLDHFDNVLIEKKTPRQTIVYSEEAAYITNTILQDVAAHGTASGTNPMYNNNGEPITVAGKTGTTNDTKDSWFVGFTPYYAAAVWYGYDKNTPIPEGEWGISLNIWNIVMRKIHANMASAGFTEPAGLVKREICMRSGQRVTSNCMDDPMNIAFGVNYAPVRTELFIKGTEPTETCKVHIVKDVCKDFTDGYGRALLAGSNCPKSSVEKRVLIQRPYKYSSVKDGDPLPFDLVFGISDIVCSHGNGSTPGIASPSSNTDSKKSPDNTKSADKTGTPASPQNTTLSPGT